MLELHTFGTPNGKKISIALEEMNLPYEVHVVDIMKDDQFKPDFLKISPNNKIPALVDPDVELSLMESGAILFYLATKTSRYIPSDPYLYWQCMEWLMWQMGGFGPMLGQANHFLHFNPGVSDYAEKRYGEEARRLYGVLDRHLADNEYVAEEYSIADMAIFPWACRAEWQDIDLNEFPNLVRWYRAIAARPAVRRGYDVPVETAIPMP